jgi:hypothetical protein
MSQDCTTCKAHRSAKSKKEGQAKTQAKSQEKHACAQGKWPTCISCPKGMVSKFTRQKDGTFFVPCDYHQLKAWEDISNQWEWLKTLIDPETQAHCQKCSDLSTPDQMIHQYYNVRGQATIERRDNLCPTHFASAKVKAAERRDEHWKKLIKEMLDQLELHAPGATGGAYEQCQSNREQLHAEHIRRHPDNGTCPNGTCLYTSTFDCNHEPQRRDRKDVHNIVNDILRAKERKTTQPLCTSTCHQHKTWSQFDWIAYYDQDKHKTQTHYRVSEYMKLKLRRFQGDNPHPA